VSAVSVDTCSEGEKSGKQYGTIAYSGQRTDDTVERHAKSDLYS